MSRVETQVLGQQTQATGREKDRRKDWAKQAAIVIAASLFVAVCARVTVPLPFTPVPLTLQNFGVLAVGLLLGSRRGFAALSLYLAEGAFGLPVFSPAILGSGITHLLGPTGGFLMAYPLVAFVAGWIYEQKSEQSSEESSEKSSSRFGWAALSAVAAEIVLFAGGLSWLAVLTHSISLAIRYGLYWFVFAEVIKVLMAAGVAARWRQRISSPR
ncbi:MAG: biotin transporter BioY [Terriglobales bacterium]|jgi:biotin transport system substrate-specific component